MGVLDLLRRGARPDYLAGPVDAIGISSPWSDAALSPIVWADVFGGGDELPLTRSAAMGIPAVAKGRNLLCSAIAGLPLRALDTNGLLAEQPRWMSRTDGPIPPTMRMLWTVDDLIFFGASLWLVKRGADKQILEADRCPTERWKVTEGHILVDDEEVDQDDVLFIQGPHEGLLTLAARTLRGARDQEKTWVARAKNPIALVELHMTDDSELDPEEAKAFVTQWSKNRNDVDGAIGFTPRGLEVRVHGTVAADMVTEGRNAVRVDIGSFLGIPATLMDASLAESTLTYSTVEGNRSRFHDETLPMWTGPIADRLSMDDVVPRGQRTRFDYSGLTGPAPIPTGVPTDD